MNTQLARSVIQALMLLLFLLLWAYDNIHVWAIFILITWLLSILLGRIYCGWICPIFSLMRPMEWLIKRLGFKKKLPPSWVKSPLIKNSLFIILFGLLVSFLFAMGLKSSMMQTLIIVGLIFALFSHSELWHRYFCPFGLLFSLSSIKNPFGVQVITEKCVGCNKCTLICPSGAIKFSMTSKLVSIQNRYCLECLECQETCPKDAISFSRKPPQENVKCIASNGKGNCI